MSTPINLISIPTPLIPYPYPTPVQNPVQTAYYKFDVSNNLIVTNNANGGSINDATLSQGGLIKTTRFKNGTSALNLQTQYTRIVGITKRVTDISMSTDPNYINQKDITGMGITIDQKRIVYCTGYGIICLTIKDANGNWGTAATLNGTRTNATNSLGSLSGLSGPGVAGGTEFAVYGLKITPDGNTIIFGTSTGGLIYGKWNGTTYAPFTLISTGFGEINGVDITLDGSRYFFTVAGGSLYYGDRNGTGYNTPTATSIYARLCVACNADGSRIIYKKNAGSYYGYYAYWNGTTSTYVEYTTAAITNFEITGCRLSQDGNIAFITDNNNPCKCYIYYWSGTNYTRQTTDISFAVTGTGTFRTLELTGDGKTLYTTKNAGAATPTIQVFDISYNYTTRYVTLPSITTTNTSTGFSVVGWISSYSPSTAPIFDLGNGATSDNIILSIIDGYLSITVYSGSTPYTKTDTTTFINNNTWTQIAVSLSNASSSVWTIYVNGIPILTTSTNTVYPAAITRTSNFIGKSNNTAATQPSFSGAIDDFYIYDGVLPMNDSCIAHYNFEVFNNLTTVTNNLIGNATLSQGGLIKTSRFKNGTSALNLQTLYSIIVGITKKTTINFPTYNTYQKDITGMGITIDQKRMVYFTGYGTICLSIKDANGNWGSPQTLNGTTTNGSGSLSGLLSSGATGTTDGFGLYGGKMTLDGNTIICGGSGGTLIYGKWNGTTTYLPLKLISTGDSYEINGVDITLDGSRYFYTINGGPLYYGDRNDISYNKPTATSISARVCVACNADGSRIIYKKDAAPYYCYYASWNGTTYVEYGAAAITNFEITGCRLSQDGNIAFITDNNNPCRCYIYYWDGTNYTRQTTDISFDVTLTSQFRTLELTGDGKTLYTTKNNNPDVPFIEVYDISYNYTPRYVTLPSITTTNTSTGFSVVGWISSYSPLQSTAPIFDLGNGATSDNIILSIIDGCLSITVYLGSTAYTKTDTTTFINNNTWYHIVVTLSNASPSVWTIYVDGIPILTTSTDTIYPAAMTRTSNFIGKSNNTATQPLFSVAIDDFCIYSTLLSSNNIISLYNNQVSFTNYGNNNVNVYYHFNSNDVVGTTVANYAYTTPIYDASLSQSGLINGNNYKYGTSALNLISTITDISSSSLSSNNTAIPSTPIGGITGITVTSDGNRMIICSHDNQKLYFTTRTNGVWNTSFTQIMEASAYQYTKVKVTPNGSRLVALTTGNYLYIYKWSGTTYTNQTRTLEPNIRNYYGLDMTGDGSMIFVTANDAPFYSFATWIESSSNYSTLTKIEYPSTLGNGTGNGGIACTIDGSRIIYSDNNRNVYFANKSGANYLTGTRFGDAITTSLVQNTRLTSDGSIAFISVNYDSNKGVVTYYWNGTTYNNAYIIPTNIVSFSKDYWSMELSRDNNTMYITHRGAISPIQIININYNINPQYLTLPLITTTSSGFSIACWISSSYLSYFAPIFDLGNGATSDNIILTIVGGYLSITVYIAATSYTITDTTTFINKNTWYHIAVTLTNASPSVWTIYVNGIAVLTTSTGTMYPTAMTRTSNFIGKSNNTATTQLSSSSINEFYIYSGILSPRNIISLYNLQSIQSTSISPSLIPINYTTLTSKPVTYYYDICGNELYNSFSPISLLSPSLSTYLSTINPIPFIGKPRIPYDSSYANTTISTLTIKSPASITFDKKYNNTYISDTSGVIYKINLYTGLVSLIVGNYTANTGTITTPLTTDISSNSSLFNYPLSTAFDINGNFYIADQNTGQIAKMDLNASTIKRIEYSDTGNKPNCILINNSSILYYSYTGGIRKFSLLGTTQSTAAATTTTSTTIDSTFTSAIYQMVFYPTNQNLIYGIATTLTPLTIRVFNVSTPASSYSITFPSGITSGYGITFDSIGNLYVTSNIIIYFLSNVKINSITVTTTLTATDYSIYSSTGINGTAYSGLRWLSVDNANNLYASDTSGNIVYKYINNTYNTNYLLPSNLDLGTTFMPKMMLGGTSSQIGSFPISNYIVDSLNSPIEYYIEGATYNIIDNSGLICHYMFNYQDISGVNVGNYASGSFVYDASLSATGMGYRTVYITGNGCLNLTATSFQYVTVNNSTIKTTAWPPTGGAITFACWIKPNISSLSSQRIFDFGNGSTNNIILTFTPTGTIQAYVYNGSTSNNVVVYNTNVNTNNWCHLVWVINQSGSLFYVNGINVSTKTLAEIPYPNAIARTNCYIGSSNGANYYNGQIDDFRIYNRAITDTEAFKLYSFNELSHYYKFDSKDISSNNLNIANYATGYPIYDATLSAANTASNGIINMISMVGNSSLYLSTNSNYLNIPMPNISTNGFTIAFWMNTTMNTTSIPNTGTNPCMLWLNGVITPNVNSLYLKMTNSSSNIVLTFVCGNNSNQTTFNSSNKTINDGAWHHIVITSTYAAANTSTISMYIDSSYNNGTTTGYYQGALQSSGHLIGYSAGVLSNAFYTGYIDDFRIYRKVLSPPEIVALYNFTYNNK